MSKNTKVAAFSVCVLGTLIGSWAADHSIAFSFILGPLLHFGLGFSRLNNGLESLDGVSRVEASDYWVASVQGVVWVLGLCGVFTWLKEGSKTSKILVGLGWAVVGVGNVLFFALRSV